MPRDRKKWREENKEKIKIMKKEWHEANPDKQKIYSARYRLRKKGIEVQPENIAELEAIREAKKAATKERDRERKKKWAQDNRELIRARYREKYHSDSEFRNKQIEKRKKNLEPLRDAKRKEKEEKRILAQQSREDQLRQKREEAARKRKMLNAQKHAEDVAKAERIPPRSKPKTTPKPHPNARKPGRLLALMGWRGY